MVARVPPSSSRDASQNFPTPSLPHSSSPSPFSLHLSSFLPLHSHTTTPVLPHPSMLRPAPTTSATSALARADQAIKQRRNQEIKKSSDGPIKQLNNWYPNVFKHCGDLGVAAGPALESLLDRVLLPERVLPPFFFFSGALHFRLGPQPCSSRLFSIERGC